MTREEIVGEIYESNNYGKFKVLKKDGRKPGNRVQLYLIEFLETGYQCHKAKSCILRGAARDPYIPTVHGVGFLGETSCLDSEGKSKPSYKRWRTLIRIKGNDVKERWKCFQHYEEDLKNLSESLPPHHPELGDPYTEEETEVISDYYPHLGASGILEQGLIKGRSRSSIIAKAHRMNITCECAPTWKLNELEILNKFYYGLGAKGIHKKGLLTHKSVSAIQSQAQRMNLTFCNYGEWSERELQIIRDYYHELGPSVMIKVGMTDRSQGSLSRKAAELGLISQNAGDSWSKEEERIMKEHYPSEGAAGIFRKGLLGTHRSHSMIAAKASNMGLGYGGGSKNRKIQPPKGNGSRKPHKMARLLKTLKNK